MYINYLRASTANTYNSCQFQYFLNYVCNIESKAGKKALLGTIVHHALEIIAKAKKTKHYLLNDKYINPEYLLNICWDRYTKANPQFEYAKADKTFCLKQINTVLDSDFNPLKLNILETEAQFDFKIYRDKFKYYQLNPVSGMEETDYFHLRGTVDLLTERNHETLEVIDYKTGKRLDWASGDVKELEHFTKDLQLRMYDIATSKMYPKYKFRLLTLFFTQDGGPFTVTFDAKDQHNTFEIFHKLFQQISQNKQPTRLIDDKSRKEEFWKCNYVCQFGLYEVEFISDDGEVHIELIKKTPNTVIPEFLELNGVKYYKSSRKPTTVCERLFNNLKEIGMDEMTKVMQPTISASSRRNNYSRAGIHYGQL